MPRRRRSVSTPVSPPGSLTLPSPGGGGRWEFLLGGLAAGAFGFLQLRGQEPNWLVGVPLQAASAWLLWKAFPARTPGGPPLPDLGEGSRAEPAPAAGRFLWPLLGLAAAAQAFWAAGRALPGSLLWVLAFLFLLVLLRFLPERYPLPTRVREGVDLVLLLAVAACLRFPFAGRHLTGLQIDEANHLLDSLGFLEGKLKTPFQTAWWGNPALPHFLVAGAFAVFGASVTVARVVSMAVSLVSVWVFHRLCRRFFSAEVSLLAGLLFATSWWHLFYAHSPFHNIFTMCFEAAAFLFLVRALQEGKRGDFFLFGAFAAASVMTYLPGRLVPAMAAGSLFLALLFRRREFLRRTWRHLALSLLAFLWLLGPFLDFAVQHFQEIMGRTRELSILKAMEHQGDPWLPLRTFGWSFLTFSFPNVGIDPRFGIKGVPLLAAPTAFLAMLGFALTLASPRRPFTWILLPGFVAGLAADALAVQGLNALPHYVNPMRYFLVTPFLFLLAARALEWLRGCAPALSPAARRAGKAALVLWVAWGAVAEAKVFFHRIPRETDWVSLGHGHILAGEVVNRLYPDYHVLVHWENFASVAKFLTYGRSRATVIDENYPLPLSAAVERDVAFVMTAWEFQDLQRRIRETYPEATLEVWKTPSGQPYLAVYRVPREAVESRRRGPPQAALP